MDSSNRRTVATDGQQQQTDSSNRQQQRVGDSRRVNSNQQVMTAIVGHSSSGRVGGKDWASIEDGTAVTGRICAMKAT